MVAVALRCISDDLESLDRERVTNAMVRLGALAEMHSFFRVLYTKWFYLRSVGFKNATAAVSEALNELRMLPEELLDWEEKPGSESRKANLQKLRKDTRELIREKKQEEEEQKETRKPERKGRHPKYGEGEIISEDEMMIELEFPGYGKKQFLKAFGEVEVLKGL